MNDVSEDAATLASMVRHAENMIEQDIDGALTHRLIGCLNELHKIIRRETAALAGAIAGSDAETVSGKPMTQDEFNEALAMLGIKNPSDAAPTIGCGPRMSRRYANGEWPVPIHVALILRMMLSAQRVQ